MNWIRVYPIGPCDSPDGHELDDILTLASTVPVSTRCTRCHRDGQILVGDRPTLVIPDVRLCPVCEQPRYHHDPRCRFEDSFEAQRERLAEAVGALGRAILAALPRPLRRFITGDRS